MNRLVFNTVVRTARVNPVIRSAAPYRWVRFGQNLFEHFYLNVFIVYFSNRAILLLDNKHKDLPLQRELPVVLLFFSEVRFLSHAEQHVVEVFSVHPIPYCYFV